MLKYRYSLFTTTDVYYIVQVDKTNFTIKNTNTELCVRPESFVWGIDYEPDPAGNFGKTATGDLLDIPIVDYSTLPIPIDYLVEQPEHGGGYNSDPGYGGLTPIVGSF